ncbi:putative enoyl-CoA hydratase EchA10 (enoyl hydrase) (unsaturated acyl-CoA hydratase) (crotonase) [Mycobacterium tuberculosis H37Rv] [Mycolicibacterium parafortuitum]|uniref:Putative enoyl-CoA hydratase EchA10 (Enoyl hydrase) (Unsaturated acyl-CoA hydratase) (Crotonase) [Mycobacterium tuberculosis H37Rv] n=2 Tax=Mycolicibacterium parafortuitum TaxID=39692 RepID=A0A375YR15_MYCPF|nr:putative enoyl-CoA hydratase EchA10 (enoyl hydrase) (unsaturated acyl-CoA hydratase) (crotonase) [Mycobacterium tuberculosis H37Rv] [Mycolicibacterium parafortuitum]
MKGTFMTTTDAYQGIDHLTVSLDGGVLTVTLNRPDSLNSLSAPMLETFAATLERAAGDSRVRVVRIGGAGRGFCSGAGISEEDHANPGASGTPDDVLDAANRCIRAIANLPQPAVAVVQGAAAGVGVSLALACDVVLASEKAFFMLAFTKIGLMPDGGASALIAAAVGRIRALRMALLAERIPAAEAYNWGLVSAVYPADDFETEVDKVVNTLVTGPAASLRLTKNAINAATLTELEPALERETKGQLELLHSNDFREGTQAFQQRRAPKFTDV